MNADLIGRSPCRGIKLPSGRVKQRVIAGADEIHAVADAVEPEYRAMVLVAAELGLRWGECAGAAGARPLRARRRTVHRATQRGEVRGVTSVGEPQDRCGYGARLRPLSRSWPSSPSICAVGRRTAENADVRGLAAPEGGPLRYSVFRPACVGSCSARGGRGRADVPRPAALGDDGLGARMESMSWMRATLPRPLDGARRCSTCTPTLTIVADWNAAELAGARLFGRAQELEARPAP